MSSFVSADGRVAGEGGPHRAPKIKQSGRVVLLGLTRQVGDDCGEGWGVGGDGEDEEDGEDGGWGWGGWGSGSRVIWLTMI